MDAAGAGGVPVRSVGHARGRGPGQGERGPGQAERVLVRARQHGRQRTGRRDCLARCARDEDAGPRPSARIQDPYLRLDQSQQRSLAAGPRPGKNGRRPLLGPGSASLAPERCGRLDQRQQRRAGADALADRGVPRAPDADAVALGEERPRRERRGRQAEHANTDGAVRNRVGSAVRSGFRRGAHKLGHRSQSVRPRASSRPSQRSCAWPSAMADHDPGPQSSKQRCHRGQPAGR